MYDTFSVLLGNGLQSHDFERFTAGKTPTEKRQRVLLIVFFLLPFCDKARNPVYEYVFKVRTLSVMVRRMGLEPTRELTTGV